MTTTAAEGTRSLLFVVGMRREARILGVSRRTLVGAAGLAEVVDDAADDRPGGLVSFGLCGALDPSLRLGDIVIASAVAAPDGRFDTDRALSYRLSQALPWAALGLVWGSDAIVGDRAEKAALAEASGAAAVDMESHAVARAARRASLPFAVVRAVSDRAMDTLPRAAQAGFRPDGRVDLAAVIAALAHRPWELPALIRIGQGAEAGFRALARASSAMRPSA